MGVNNFCSACSDSKNKEGLELNPYSKDLKGQYNNYKDFSYFNLHIFKKNLICEDYEIEGIFINKKGKSAFKGKLSKKKIEIETKSIYADDSPEYTFSGTFDEEKKKYTGSFSRKRTANSEGNFWIELLDHNFWGDVTSNRLTSSITPSSAFYLSH
jgi:hypothetical protein